MILNQGAANCYISLVFIPIKLARGATKYFKYYVRVLRTKKSLGNTASNNAESVNNKFKKCMVFFVKGLYILNVSIKFFYYSVRCDYFGPVLNDNNNKITTTITDDFYLWIFDKWQLKCDHIKWLLKYMIKKWCNVVFYVSLKLF